MAAGQVMLAIDPILSLAYSMCSSKGMRFGQARALSALDCPGGSGAKPFRSERFAALISCFSGRW